MKNGPGEASKKTDLSPFFEPENLAVIGSLREDWLGGYVVVKSLLKAGYAGDVFPVNAAYKEVLGLPAYPSVKDIPRQVSLAVIMINAKGVPNTIEQCGEKGVKKCNCYIGRFC